MYIEPLKCPYALTTCSQVIHVHYTMDCTVSDDNEDVEKCLSLMSIESKNFSLGSLDDFSRVFSKNLEDDVLIRLLSNYVTLLMCLVDADVLEMKNQPKDIALMDPYDKIKYFLYNKFDEFKYFLLRRMLISKEDLSGNCLSILFKCLTHENSIKKDGNTCKIKSIMDILFNNLLPFQLVDDSKFTISKFVFNLFIKQYMSYTDIRTFFLVYISQSLKVISTQLMNKENCDRCKKLLLVRLSKVIKKCKKYHKSDSIDCLIYDEFLTSNFYRKYKNILSEAWLGYISLSLVVDQTNTDFKEDFDFFIAILTDSQFNKFSDIIVRSLSMNNDSYSIDCINALIHLIANHNLNFPAIFQLLYKKIDVILQPNINSYIFSIDEKIKFLNLINLALSSMNLSAIMVTAFIKKLSYYSVFQPVQITFILIKLIHSIIGRHPITSTLINNNSESTKPIIDPFDINESKFELCNASGSSLWELEFIRDTCLSTTMRAFIKKKFSNSTNKEFKDSSHYKPLKSNIHYSYESLFTNEYGKCSNETIDENNPKNKKAKISQSDQIYFETNNNKVLDRHILQFIEKTL